MTPENNFKSSIALGDHQIGLWMTLGAETATEIACVAGFDWLLFDMEHTALSLESVLYNLRTAAVGNAEPIVRIPWNDTVTVKRILDLGVRTLMVPFVQNADEAAQAVAATRYPPDGVRGFAGMTRATGFGRNPGYARTASDEICLIVQIETPAAIDAISEIAAVDGVDALFVGPNDLAANMGRIGGASSDEVQAQVRRAVDAIRAAGKPAGLLDYRVEAAKRWFEAGVSFIGVGGDTSLLARSIRAVAAEFDRTPEG